MNDPLKIAEIPVGTRGGAIGITFAPGKRHVGRFSGCHERDLSTDLDAIQAWGATRVVTLVETWELHEMQIEDLGSRVRQRDLVWHHRPIVDVSTPDRGFMRDWPPFAQAMNRAMHGGERVLIHCKGGLGRAGMIAARLLVEDGMAAGKAMQTVRAVRPGAIETRPQERWVSRPVKAPT